MENRCLPADPNPKGRWRSLDGGTDVHSGEGEPGGVLSLTTRPPEAGPGSGTARCPATDRPGVSQLRVAADDGGAPTARLGRESQTGLPSDAGGQPALPASAEVCGDDGLRPRSAGLSQPGSGHDADGAGSALGG